MSILGICVISVSFFMLCGSILIFYIFQNHSVTSYSGLFHFLFVDYYIKTPWTVNYKCANNNYLPARPIFLIGFTSNSVFGFTPLWMYTIYWNVWINWILVFFTPPFIGHINQKLVVVSAVKKHTFWISLSKRLVLSEL